MNEPWGKNERISSYLSQVNPRITRLANPNSLDWAQLNASLPRPFEKVPKGSAKRIHMSKLRSYKIHFFIAKSIKLFCPS